ncbi:hypothetical protein JYU20_00835 [Bacteroidales bacterium AH-315-I05]|nr:hypothetical protein [Bacteroidales bacterium AH-315-I05]
MRVYQFRHPGYSKEAVVKWIGKINTLLQSAKGFTNEGESYFCTEFSVMQDNGPPQVYFHVGLGKAASTYLQYKVFPKLKGIHYIQRTSYKKSKKIIARANSDKYLVSREFDRQLEDEVRWFSSFCPEARVIIIFRRHDSWIASQYRRHVKNGNSYSFSEFIDIENDNGFWKKKELCFFEKIKTIEQYFQHKPLVLFHDELKKDPYKFINKIADFTCSTYKQEAISLSPKHRSYNEKQLKIMRKVSRYVYIPGQNEQGNKLQRRLQLYSKRLACYVVLYAALFVPKKFVSKEKLISQAELDKIRKYFEEDWQRCLNYAKDNNPVTEQVANA